jgi:hypothetical protein
MVLKTILLICAMYNIIWSGDYIKGLLALIMYEVFDILQRLDKLENKK